ncbi:neurogenic locus Notch protein [Diabrotica virgifera virgifera]|uniref:Neurogenic locus Notch protein-like n=1 Tax=Diabrotica virgifera virgifera TaxID=50390 RepID=A0ABM5ITQ5_DIAVI|nr:neurogenic locus Notch protein [Diabrotica virgifera virgifera]
MLMDNLKIHRVNAIATLVSGKCIGIMKTVYEMFQLLLVALFCSTISADDGSKCKVEVKIWNTKIYCHNLILNDTELTLDVPKISNTSNLYLNLVNCTGKIDETSLSNLREVTSIYMVTHWKYLCNNVTCETITNTTCVQTNSGYNCTCPKTTTGPNCEINLVNEFDISPSQKHIGKICEVFDRSAPEGVGKPVTQLQDFNKTYTMVLEKQRQECIRNKCHIKRGNMRCDEECNTYACDFDGYDCSLGINPWANCTAPTKCWEVFMDGRCNEDCNNPQCLFDGRDCEKKLQACNPIYDAYCKKHYANGFCDYGCNNDECNWDGLDCEKEPPEQADGVITMVILMDMESFKNNLGTFLRDTSHQLRTTVRVKKDQLGNDMIYPWMGSTPSDNQQDGYFRKKQHVVYSEQAQTGVKVFLELDNRKCASLVKNSDFCFQTASAAAEFLAAKASKHMMPSSFPIYQVNGTQINAQANADKLLLQNSGRL